MVVCMRPRTKLGASSLRRNVSRARCTRCGGSGGYSVKDGVWREAVKGVMRAMPVIVVKEERKAF